MKTTIFDIVKVISRAIKCENDTEKDEYKVEWDLQSYEIYKVNDEFFELQANGTKKLFHSKTDGENMKCRGYHLKVQTQKRF